MEVFKEKRLELVVSDSGRPANSYQGLLDSQMELFYSQTDQLENILATQCALTGVNPLSQEMAAGALSIKIGKRPRDLLNPKAVKYMQSVFSIKDAITKKESREISALFGVTVTQVREFFNSQRSRVRKYVRLSRDKALRCSSSEQVEEGVPMSNDPAMPIYPVPLNCMEPARVEEGASSSTLVETLPGLDDSDRHFQENIFSVMRKEETFSGQVKLMEWILQIQSSSLLLWFLTNGGVMILATWLSQAASEEQTSVLHVILEVLCYLPLHKALPVHMSAILQSVNRLRFYKTSDISNRARNLLSGWSKMFARAQALKKPSVVKSSSDAENEMLLKQSINEIMGDKSWESKFDLPGDSLAPSIESPENFRRLESTQPLKLLPSSADDSNKKPVRGVSSLQTKERRKVLFVEQPGQKPTGRSSQVARSVNVNQGRPLSADDIQKAKMRAHFMQSKHGKSGTVMLPASKPHVRPEVEQQKEPMRLPPKVPILEGAAIGNKMNLDVDERLWKKCRKVQIPWKTPAEMNIADAWSVGTGANSKEVEIQRNRIRREKETIYRTTQEIPRDPNEPWDREMEYDDTLTLEIPIEQLPDNENGETEPSTSQIEPTSVNTVPPLNINNGSLAEPDPQLLAELLKHPELVFALQSGGLSGEEMVKLLDMIKANGVASLGSLANGLVARKAESVPVSLPSPTPSSDAVTSGWRPEVAKNPFSRQNRGTVAMSEVAVSTSSRVRSELPPVNTVAQQLSTASTRHQHEMPQYSLPHAAAVSTISAPQQAPAINSSNRPLNNPHLPNLHSMQIENSGYVKPAAVSITVNRPPVSFQTPPTPQPHLRFVAEPMLPSHSWRPNQNQNQNWASNPHFQPHQNNNYNGFVQQGPYYRERNEFVSGAEFESWSPDNSPFRPTGWSYPEQRMNTNTNMGQYNFRPEFDGPGPWNAFGSRDYNGHGNKRRRDWRR